MEDSAKLAFGAFSLEVANLPTFTTGVRSFLGWLQVLAF